MDALNKAVSYLNIKPRTRAQVVKYLKGRGFGEDEISEAVSRLEEYHYIDDFEFACLYFNLGFEKGHGLSRIKRELYEKGVSDSDVEAACESLDSVPDQLEEALKAGSKALTTILGRETDREVALREMSYGERSRLQAKIARRLASKGFTADIVFKAAKEITKC